MGRYVNIRSHFNMTIQENERRYTDTQIRAKKGDKLRERFQCSDIYKNVTYQLSANQLKNLEKISDYGEKYKIITVIEE